MIVRVQTPDGQFRVEVAETCDMPVLKAALEQACGVRTWDQALSRDIAGKQKIPEDGRSLRAMNVKCVFCGLACVLLASPARCWPR